MSREDFGGRGGRGGGRGGRSRGGRGDGRRGGGSRRSGGGRGGSRYGHGRGGGFRGQSGGRRMHPGRAADSGNQRERISVESGTLVLIDQFMLANPQFIAEIKGTIDSPPEAKNNIIAAFGGVVVDVTPGTYRIDRDPFKYTIMIHPDGEQADINDILASAPQKRGQVDIDTRCLAMIDRELLDDHPLLDKYSQQWQDFKEKTCRDLLRDNGGAVRYGFGRFGDSLGVYCSEESGVISLWPDNREEMVKSSESAAESRDDGHTSDEPANDDGSGDGDNENNSAQI